MTSAQNPVTDTHIMDRTQLANLVVMSSPKAVWDEVQYIHSLIKPTFDLALLKNVFSKTLDLYAGRFPGYQACNTGFHDLEHATDTLLTIARLIHGAYVTGNPFLPRYVYLGLVSALLHDAGYIQEDDDVDGTGGKYTLTHVQRSMDFLSRVGPDFDLSEEEITACRAMILYTDLTVDVADVKFPNAEAKAMGQMLGVADIWAQISSRTYLEKVLFLYHEFRAANIEQYTDEVDLLRKTVGFYDYINQRLAATQEIVDLYLRAHFISRWEINSNLYEVAIERQKSYLQQILAIPNSDPRHYLRRDGPTEKARRKY